MGLRLILQSHLHVLGMNAPIDLSESNSLQLLQQENFIFWITGDGAKRLKVKGYSHSECSINTKMVLYRLIIVLETISISQNQNLHVGPLKTQ